MKRIVLAGALVFATFAPALAADLPPPAPVPYVPVVRAFSWTGFYLGLNGGYGFGQSSWNTALGTVGGFKTDGGLAGGTAGFNYQWGQFVVGIEGDGDWQNIRGTQTTAGPCVTVGVGSCNTASNWISTIRGRAGFAVNRALIYATGGAAFTDVKAWTAASPFGGGSEPGWTGGGGVEFAMTDSWTVKLEYLYAKFQSATCPASSCSAAAPATVSLNENIVRVGVNYLFNY
jgi:outer membrane immunogenic protein